MLNNELYAIRFSSPIPLNSRLCPELTESQEGELDAVNTWNDSLNRIGRLDLHVIIPGQPGWNPDWRSVVEKGLLKQPLSRSSDSDVCKTSTSPAQNPRPSIAKRSKRKDLSNRSCSAIPSSPSLIRTVTAKGIKSRRNPPTLKLPSSPLPALNVINGGCRYSVSEALAALVKAERKIIALEAENKLLLRLHNQLLTCLTSLVPPSSPISSTHLTGANVPGLRTTDSDAKTSHDFPTSVVTEDLKEIDSENLEAVHS